MSYVSLGRSAGTHHYVLDSFSPFSAEKQIYWLKAVIILQHRNYARRIRRYHRPYAISEYLVIKTAMLLIFAWYCITRIMCYGAKKINFGWQCMVVWFNRSHVIICENTTLKLLRKIILLNWDAENRLLLLFCRRKSKNSENTHKPVFPFYFLLTCIGGSMFKLQLLRLLIAWKKEGFLACSNTLSIPINWIVVKIQKRT